VRFTTRRALHTVAEPILSERVWIYLIARIYFSW
jgi:hypothetical protein